MGKLRWWIIALVTLGTVLNYLARSTLSVAVPTMKTEFSMTTEDYSWVVLAFQASYTVMQTVAGSILDALVSCIGFTLFAVGWALSNMAHAFATGTWSLAFFSGFSARQRLQLSRLARKPCRNSCRQEKNPWQPACFRWVQALAT